MIIRRDNVLENLKNLEQAKNNYDILKKNLELERLRLKYSEEFAVYKTIKEKEERARLATEEEELNLLVAKRQLRRAKHLVEVDELDMYFFNSDDTISWSTVDEELSRVYEDTNNCNCDEDCQCKKE